MQISILVEELETILPGRIRRNVPLSAVSQWRIGGVADIVVSPKNAEQLALLRSCIFEHNIQSVVIGATSNLLFSDAGVRALVIHIGPEFSSLHIDGGVITAEPGLWVPQLARCVMRLGLVGLEHTCGIPGTLGGLVYMNGGSMRHGISECITSVSSVDSKGAIIERSALECEFKYRASVYQNLDEVISGIKISLKTGGNVRELRRSMLGILRDRRKKFPRKLPNCGSVFVSNPAMYEDFGPPGKVIEQCGLKGLRIGNAEVSNLHANFIVNIGGASATDVRTLIDHVKATVAAKTGYLMQVEARFVTPEGSILEM